MNWKLLVLLQVLSGALVAQSNVINDGYEHAPQIEWQKCIGGSDEETLIDFKDSGDGNFLILFTSKSSDFDIDSINAGYHDLILFKVSKAGVAIWKRYTRTNRGDNPHQIVVLPNNEIVVLSDKSENQFRFQKFNQSGDLLRDYSSNSLSIFANGSTALSNTEFVVTGSSYSSARMVIETFDSMGNKLSSTTNFPYDGYNTSRGYDLVLLPDSSLICVGYYSERAATQFPDNYSGGFDGLVSRVSKEGAVLYNKCYGGVYDDYLRSVTKTADGNLLLVGYSSSVFRNNYYTPYNTWVIKVDYNGNVIWEQKYGGTGQESGLNVIELNNSDILISGYTASSDGQFSKTGNTGGVYPFLIYLRSDGHVKWQRRLGPSQSWVNNNTTNNSNLKLLVDGDDIYLCAFARGNLGDVTGHKGGSGWHSSDIWLVKLNLLSYPCEGNLLYAGLEAKDLLINSTNHIISTGKAKGNFGNLLFETNDFIQLDEGFEVSNGAVFETKLQSGCE